MYTAGDIRLPLQQNFAQGLEAIEFTFELGWRAQDCGLWASKGILRANSSTDAGGRDSVVPITGAASR